MTILTQVEQVEIEYASSDGEPMAESDITRDYMTYSVEAVKLYFQERSDVYVSANSFIYYEQGNNREHSILAKSIFFTVRTIEYLAL
ncbi:MULTISPECIES: hypothetical protein [unclassified Microcoleus]|uniref:hypothetical protein n=1 Tax=unclassified Microcoleus TaxID=2642155 RepID=UPI002FCED631